MIRENTCEVNSLSVAARAVAPFPARSERACQPAAVVTAAGARAHSPGGGLGSTFSLPDRLGRASPRGLGHLSGKGAFKGAGHAGFVQLGLDAYEQGDC